MDRRLSGGKLYAHWHFMDSTFDVHIPGENTQNTGSQGSGQDLHQRDLSGTKIEGNG